ncbi:hypothetical protein [Streptomyces caeruleatus]|uniref:Uncharacterized protein n=1 Tax=Streptomyces caeruleatus TaxID=661399 RepID=A0A101U6M3_9ACTN|nr:hypothetical protein [Streptomyces caeruleatus]KUO05202.1 hypothetical protein AQJ67_07395 [Streptomyces caeruleatus]
MRTRTALAALAFAGTVLLGGAGQALADEHDETGGFGVEAGTSSPAAPDFGQSNSDQDESGFGQDASGFGQSGSVFDEASGF